jgi:hypothetical protein
VPKAYEEDPSLGIWVHNQRKRLKNGKLDQERKRRLEEIDFVFISKEEKWNVQFDNLRQFKNDNGHCEWLSALDRFTFILDTPTNTSRFSLPD